MTEEDEAFNEIERMSKVRQEILRSLNRKRQVQEAERAFDEQHPIWKRNQVIEEVAVELETKFTGPFGRDTVASFATYIRGMKR
jgi:hypothetical protein